MAKSPPAYDIIYRFFTAPRIRGTAVVRSSPPRQSLNVPRAGEGGEGMLSSSRRGERIFGQTRSWSRDGSRMSQERVRPISTFPLNPAMRLSRLYSTAPPPSTPQCQAPDCPHQPTATSPLPTFTSNKSTTAITSTHPAPTSLTKMIHPSYLNSLPVALRRLAIALPAPAGQPPSRDQLLALTTSFFERLRIRFKWITIRSYRRFRADDYSAFFSVGIMGTLGWFVLSTTSFFAFCFFIVNSLSLQSWLATKLGNYLTSSTGVTVVFESAIVPKWGLAGGGSRILFKNVYVSRGPTTAELGGLPIIPTGEEEEETEEQAEAREQMAKWTHFHMSIDSVEVSLSIGRWLDGKGLVKDATVTGVRGVVGESLLRQRFGARTKLLTKSTDMFLDRSHIMYDPNAPRDRFAYRHESHPGDFWLENLQVEDFLVTVYQPDHFRPVRLLS